MTLSLKKPEEVIYPNQPLKEVVCEVRFFGEPIIESKRHKFYAAVRDRYPYILVPPIKEDRHPALQPYIFQSEDGQSGVTLALNSIAYYEREYTGAINFISEFSRLFELANKLFSMRVFSRVGWRYVNVVPFAREESLIPLSRFFIDPPSFFAIDSKSYSAINFSASTRFETEQVSVKLASGADKSSSDEILIFDIDVYRENLKESNTKAGEIEELIKRFRCIARNFFESSITEEFRSYLKGEDIYE